MTQAAGTVLGGSPARLTGRACFAIGLRELSDAAALLQPLRLRRPDSLGPGNVIAEAASSDLGDALARIDGFKPGQVHVTGVDGARRISRGQRQAFLRKVSLPRRSARGRARCARRSSCATSAARARPGG